MKVIAIRRDYLCRCVENGFQGFGIVRELEGGVSRTAPIDRGLRLRRIPKRINVSYRQQDRPD